LLLNRRAGRAAGVIHVVSEFADRFLLRLRPDCRLDAVSDLAQEPCGEFRQDRFDKARQQNRGHSGAITCSIVNVKRGFRCSDYCFDQSHFRERYTGIGPADQGLDSRTFACSAGHSTGLCANLCPQNGCW
jgi:hypothetical protein